MTRDDGRHAGEVRRFGTLIIGDEILSGKRQDKHLVQLIDMLADRGLRRRPPKDSPRRGAGGTALAAAWPLQ